MPVQFKSSSTSIRTSSSSSNYLSLCNSIMSLASKYSNASSVNNTNNKGIAGVELDNAVGPALGAVENGVA